MNTRTRKLGERRMDEDGWLDNHVPYGCHYKVPEGTITQIFMIEKDRGDKE